jgi:superfamily II DNA or RNA helicase
MIEIKVNNSKCKVDCTLEEMAILRKNLRIRAPGAWYSDAFRKRVWDGFNYYITDSGYLHTGLLPKLLELLEKQNWEYEITDQRDKVKHGKIPTRVGKLELRDYQFKSTESVVKNRIKDIYFPRGVLNEATNAGKNLIAAALFKAYKEDKKLIFIVNRKHIYLQGKKEIQELIGNEVGYIGDDGVKWNRFMICMAQTVSKKIHSFKSQLSQFDICLVDECHYASSKTFQVILLALENCYLRVGLSGTPFKHKDKNKNEKILSYFGPILHSTSNDDLIRLGFSTKPIVTILNGNTLIKIPKEYKEEETLGLIKSKERNGQVLKRVKKHVSKKRLPLLLICKFHNHTELLHKKVSKKFPDLKVEFIHVKVKNRMEILKNFKDGKIDILVSSKLIKEGQNLPLIRALIIAAGGDSVIDVLQIVGRALRKHKSKKKVYIDDFKDIGYYLARHSNHRIKVYKSEKFKIVDRTTI